MERLEPPTVVLTLLFADVEGSTRIARDVSEPERVFALVHTSRARFARATVMRRRMITSRGRGPRP